MANILDFVGLEGPVLDGLAQLPASTTRKEWFAITRQLIQETISDMDLDPATCFIALRSGVSPSSACAAGVVNALMHPRKSRASLHYSATFGSTCACAVPAVSTSASNKRRFIGVPSL